MTPAYLVSETQKALRVLIDGADRTAPDFFVISPIVIDCRADAERFRHCLTEVQRDAIVRWHKRGKLLSVSSLARPAYTYAMERLREKHAELDRETIADIKAFLADWHAERGLLPGQASKRDMPRPPSGIEIILPISGIRLGFDGSNLMLL